MPPRNPPTRGPCTCSTSWWSCGTGTCRCASMRPRRSPSQTPLRALPHQARSSWSPTASSSTWCPERWRTVAVGTVAAVGAVGAVVKSETRGSCGATRRRSWRCGCTPLGRSVQTPSTNISLLYCKMYKQTIPEKIFQVPGSPGSQVVELFWATLGRYLSDGRAPYLELLLRVALQDPVLAELQGGLLVLSRHQGQLEARGSASPLCARSLRHRLLSLPVLHHHEEVLQAQGPDVDGRFGTEAEVLPALVHEYLPRVPEDAVAPLPPARLHHRLGSGGTALRGEVPLHGHAFAG
mmetsp:Transcript_6847/g.14855  ORF Transcript_6847/g.14855 Transcript_6847/m.14855 type:complete len:294 (-) Transcript_6847:388-1269(-)